MIYCFVHLFILPKIGIGGEMMGCLRLNNIVYEGKIIEMSRNSRQRQQLNNKSNGENYVVPKSTIAVLKWVAGGCVTLLTIILGVTGWMATQLYDLNKNALSEDSTIIIDMRESVEDIEKGLNGSEGIYARLAVLEGKMGEIPVIAVSEDTQQFVDTASVERNDISISGTSITSNTYIGTDARGNVYMAEDLIGETLLLTYKEGDKEVYFLGQYNENYHWEGYCVTNAYYENGTLYGICESNFEDGNRLDYVSFYQDGDEWIYANRQLVKDENVGITINYRIENNKKKDFTTTNVRVTDILYADDYIEKIDKDITKYYTGNTVESIFEDSTGDAYEVKYDADGTVRMLYVGRFAKGYCEDATGEAFSIVYSDKYEAYFYNTGKFSKGNAEVHSKDPISVEEINEIVESYSFDCELHWKQ